MPPRKSTDSSRKGAASRKSAGSASSAASRKASDMPPSAGYLITCDVPTKQYIQFLDKQKAVDKRFIIKDLDSTHLLVKKSARAEIERKVEAWMDENVFSAVERVGEDLDIS